MEIKNPFDREQVFGHGQTYEELVRASKAQAIARAMLKLIKRLMPNDSRDEK